MRARGKRRRHSSAKIQGPDLLGLAAGGDSDGLAVRADGSARLAVSGELVFPLAFGAESDQLAVSDSEEGFRCGQPFGDSPGGDGKWIRGLPLFVAKCLAIEVDKAFGLRIELVALRRTADFGDQGLGSLGCEFEFEDTATAFAVAAAKIQRLAVVAPMHSFNMGHFHRLLNFGVELTDNYGAGLLAVVLVAASAEIREAFAVGGKAGRQVSVWKS